MKAGGKQSYENIKSYTIQLDQNVTMNSAFKQGGNGSNRA
jgi:hypothetical protein